VHPLVTPIGNSMEAVEAGVETGAGSFICVDCALPLSLDRSEEMPRCPACGGEHFKRASLFEHHEQPTLTHPTIGGETEAPAGWLERVRSSIPEPGKYLAIYADGRARLLELEGGWSRIGRSGSADVRLDDPTVSRRHAVVVHTPEGELRVLDDRSMNGISVNGEAVDWSPIADGDEVQIGRYTVHVIETAGSPAA
jgi:predicted  nucleic acid-binding Zn-ribbon protein